MTDATNRQPIENYGIIGDLTTAALVSLGGSIDFMCFPHFDSPTIFAALLDDRRGGRFSIEAQSGEFKNRQNYFPDTNILLTRFLGKNGIAEISDFMAMQHLGNSHNLVRRVKVVRGEIAFRMIFAPKFDYGRVGHTIEKRPHEVIFVPAKRDLSVLRLRSNHPIRVENGEAVAHFKLGVGDLVWFILEHVQGDSPLRKSQLRFGRF